VFGELPKINECSKAVVLDLKLKPEFQNLPLKSKCYPMSMQDTEEIERQVSELIIACHIQEF